MIIISDCLTDHADEGTIKIASKLARLLKAKGATVYQLNKEVSFADKTYKVGKFGISRELINGIKNKKGDILYIPNASMTKSVCIKVFLLSVITRRKIYLLPVYRRELSGFMKIIFALSHAELLVLSKESYDVYSKIISNPIRYIKAGVDIEQFKPVDIDTKKRLRKKYGFSDEEKIILHVGHMVEARNIRRFMELDSNNHIVLIVSTSTRWDEQLYNDLKSCRNITIIHEYIPNIEEYFQMADVYMFFVEKMGCVDVPLSVLEAAACNTKIITTPFGELKTFKESDTFMFIKDFDKVNSMLNDIYNQNICNNRSLIEEYEWNIAVDKISALIDGR